RGFCFLEVVARTYRRSILPDYSWSGEEQDQATEQYRPEPIWSDRFHFKLLDCPRSRRLTQTLLHHFRIFSSDFLGQSSPVGTMPAVSTIRITTRSGARVRCLTPLGTTNPCHRCRSTDRSSRSIIKCPSRTKKNSSSLSCLCQ